MRRIVKMDGFVWGCVGGDDCCIYRQADSDTNSVTNNSIITASNDPPSSTPSKQPHFTSSNPESHLSPSLHDMTHHSVETLTRCATCEELVWDLQFWAVVWEHFCLFGRGPFKYDFCSRKCFQDKMRDVRRNSEEVETRRRDREMRFLVRRPRTGRVE